MKYKLPFLSLVALALLASIATAQERPTASTASTSVPLPNAQQLLTEAQVALGRHGSVEAKVRQQTHLFGQELFGSGRYLQQGTGPEIMLRFELRLHVGEQPATMLQIADGRYLWSERQFGTTRSVQQIEVAQVREQLGQQHPALPGRWPLLGGLGEMLAGIAANFEFAPVTTGELGDVPIYTLVGKVRVDELNRQAAQTAADPENFRPLDPHNLPEQVPHEVLLVLGRDDLFPYLIDYRRASRAGEGSMYSLLRMQLFEVRINGPVDLRQFVYKPGSVSVTNMTEAVLEQLRARTGSPVTAARDAAPN